VNAKQKLFVAEYLKDLIATQAQYGLGTVKKPRDRSDLKTRQNLTLRLRLPLPRMQLCKKLTSKFTKSSAA
jgi:hypothetical protein